MSAPELQTQVLPTLLIGTARRPLHYEHLLGGVIRGDDPQAALKVLGLTAQALRFERPPWPPHLAVEEQVQDPRPIIPDSLRRPLFRFLAGRRGKSPATDDLALALAWTFARCGLRPHPFDLPRLDGFVAAHAAHLGPAAQRWAQREKPADQQMAYFDHGDLDEQTWPAAPPALRARFVAERRKVDAAAARALVEAAWPAEGAEGRVRLLRALHTGLSGADLPFLAALEHDSAPRVRNLASALRARLPGYPGDHPALRACLARISRFEPDPCSTRVALRLDQPPTSRPPETQIWVRETFAEVGYPELAQALALGETEMIAAASRDELLLLAFALMATRDRRLDLLALIVRRYLPAAWEQLCQSGLDDLSFMRAEERLAWAEIVVNAPHREDLVPLQPLTWLHRLLAGPAPAGLMAGILQSRAWHALLEREAGPGIDLLEILAALCPHPLRTTLKDQIAALDSALTTGTLLFLESVEGLEKAGRDE